MPTRRIDGALVYPSSIDGEAVTNTDLLTEQAG